MAMARLDFAFAFPLKLCQNDFAFPLNLFQNDSALPLNPCQNDVALPECWRWAVNSLLLSMQEFAAALSTSTLRSTAVVCEGCFSNWKSPVLAAFVSTQPSSYLHPLHPYFYPISPHFVGPKRICDSASYQLCNFFIDSKRKDMTPWKPKTQCFHPMT